MDKMRLIKLLEHCQTVHHSIVHYASVQHASVHHTKQSIMDLVSRSEIVFFLDFVGEFLHEYANLNDVERKKR